MADENSKEHRQVWKFLSQLKLETHYDAFVEKGIITTEDIYKLVDGEDAPERMMSGFGMNLNILDSQLIFLGGTDIAQSEEEEIDMKNLFFTLLQIGPNQLIQKLFPCEKMTPEKLLLQAIEMDEEDLERNPTVIEFLLTLADPNQPTKKGKLPLHVACEKSEKNFKLIETLLKAKADPNVLSEKRSPLMLVVDNFELTNENIIELLLSHGADPNLKCQYINVTKFKITPLEAELKKLDQNQKVIELFIKKGAKIDDFEFPFQTLFEKLTLEDFDGQKEEDILKKKQMQLDFIKVVFENSNPNKLYNEKTPLNILLNQKSTYALETPNKEAIEFLLKKGADQNKESEGNLEILKKVLN